MSDNRSKRTKKVIKFISRLEKDRQLNLKALVNKAKLMNMEGFENVTWDDANWQITGGRLVKITGKNTLSVTISFKESPKLEQSEFIDDWAEVAKALFVLRFHRSQQTASNQRNFINVIGYVAHCANKLKLDLSRLTPEVLDSACSLISQHYSKGAAYNLHKAVGEFAAHCDANHLCRINFSYKFSKMSRPSTTSGVGYKRLDDKAVLETTSDKMIDPEVFSILGELYRNVPKDHEYRFYVLVWTLFMCTGRRFSEILSLPHQELQKDIDGEEYLEYFPKKTSQGNTSTPRRPLYFAKQVLETVRDVITEINVICAPARDTAKYIFDNGDVDLRFLTNVPDDARLYKEDLFEIGLTGTLLAVTGWIRKNAWTKINPNKITKKGLRTSLPMAYTDKTSVIAYCKKDFKDTSHTAIHIDQRGKEYFLKDLMLVRHSGLSSGFYAQWLATECSHSMMTTNMRYLADLSEEFASKRMDVNFTTHNFRHTLNTLLDEGGLTDIMQTEWFGRTNPRDTKAYQHTSREKRILMIREDIKKGRVGGMLADEVKIFPVTQQDAILKARITALQDVGAGMCCHSFTQTACERQLSCSAECKDYLWVKDDKGRVDELKRKYSFTVLTRQHSLEKSKSSKPKNSSDWLIHNDKELKTLLAQLKDNDIDPKSFDPEEYLEEFARNQSNG